jgi:hypothetical protein
MYFFQSSINSFSQIWKYTTWPCAKPAVPPGGYLAPVGSSLCLSHLSHQPQGSVSVEIPYYKRQETAFPGHHVLHCFGAHLEKLAALVLWHSRTIHEYMRMDRRLRAAGRQLRQSVPNCLSSAKEETCLPGAAWLDSWSLLIPTL